MKKRWRLPQANKGLQEVFGREFNISPLTAQLLINRGLVESDKAFSFLKPELKDLYDPFLLKDMDRAVSRIISALVKKEKIAVYGDYDVDGTTSAALLHLFFRESGVLVETYIPDRGKEGYGLNVQAIKHLFSAGVKLIITVDCGVSNHDEILFASSLGIDVVVTDHHELSKAPPGALAVINPKQDGCAFPFKGLSGVGVAFNLVMALRARLREAGWFKEAEPNLKKYCGLVSIGTVADMVPLLDENRIFVSHGLKELQSPWLPGLKALKEACGIRANAPVDADNIAFQIAPRINAAGRVAKASSALRLLITEDHAEASSLALELDRENTARQRIEEGILKDALSMPLTPEDKGLVLFSENWHPGVIGIVASRIVERMGKPAVLVSLDGGTGKGSARGIKSFDMLGALSSCSGLLERFGGHRMAAGLTVARKNIEEFRRQFVGYLNRTLTDDDLVPEIMMDAAVSLDEMDLKLLREIESLSPFGVANRVPLFCLTGAQISATEVVKNKHLRFRLKHNGAVAGCIGFNMASFHPMRGDGFAVAFSPYLDEWQGAKNLGLRIKDIRQGDVNILT